MKPLPQHGTPARAKGRYRRGIPPCHCEPCRKALRRYDKRLRYRNASPDRTPQIDTAPVVEHLRQLRAARTSWDHIEKASGCTSSTIYRVMYEQKKMHRAVAERILAVRPAELDPQQLVPAIGSTRRVKALIAIKHGNKDIAAESGVSKEVISYLANDRLENVRADTAEKIRYGYARLSMQPGTSSRSLQRASVDCWLPPAAWDDDLIDLPEEELRAECARRVSLWSDGEVSSASCSYYSHGDRSPLTVAGKVEHYRRKAARQAAEEAARKAAEEAATQTIEGAQAA